MLGAVSSRRASTRTGRPVGERAVLLARRETRHPSARRSLLFLAALLVGVGCGAETRSPAAASTPDPGKVEALRAALRAPTITARRQAVLEIANAPLLAAALVRPLAQALRDESRWVASPAAEALGQAGPAALDALPELMAALSDADDYVRWRAAKVLAGLGPAAKEALELLERNAAAPSETEMGRHWARVAAERVRGE